MANQISKHSKKQGSDYAAIPGLGIRETESTPSQTLGTKIRVGDRTFQYVYNGSGATLTKGYLVGHDLTVLTDANLPDSAPEDQNVISIANDSNARDRGFFAEGLLIVDGGTGSDQLYECKDHEAMSADASTYTLDMYEGISTALDTTSDAKLYNSLYKVKVVPTTGLVKCVGVPLVDIADGYYGWVCTYGPSVVIGGATAGADTAERALTADTTTAGEVNIAAAGNEVIGYLIQSTNMADGTPALAYLTISA